MNTVAERDQKPADAAERMVIAPEVNIYETDDGYVLQAEMPGVSRTNIEITLDDNSLTLTGRRSDGQPKGSTLYRESRGADYRRVFELDPTVDTEKITAEMRQGVLVLSLPKAERVKPRKITIK